MEFVGVVYGKEIIRNEFGRTVAVVSYYSNKTSRLLKKWYLEEETLLKKNFLQVERISHIGSTANAKDVAVIANEIKQL